MSEGNKAPKVRVRDKIFATACGLFYKYGIRDVGVDTIAAEAGTNKMSFYRSFGSKEDLVAEYLAEKSHEFWTWWDAAVAPHPGARAQLEALFDSFVAGIRCKESRGCALANAAVELSALEHPARHVAIEQKTEMRRRFRELAVRLGASRPEELGDGLMLLMEGAFLTRVSFGSGNGPLQNVAHSARVLMDAYTTAGPARDAAPEPVATPA